MIADLERFQKFCYGIPSKEFCLHEPDFCEMPDDMERFCYYHPNHCTSNSTIPGTDYFARELQYEFLLNDSYNDPSLFWINGYDSKTRTFIDTDSFLLKCYSENLHLFQSGSKLETWNLDFFRNPRDSFLMYILDQESIELFSLKGEPQVFVAIHSPYVPIESTKLEAVRPGKEYRIDIKLETEEHLLPPPYQTDCRDNGPSKDVKNFTNPNSYEMCLDLCKSKYFTRMYGCGWEMKMIMSEDDLCYLAINVYNHHSYIGSKRERHVMDKGIACVKNCKQGCLKLQYSYKINEQDLDSEPTKSYIFFEVKNPEVTIFRHVPLYGSGEIFSHVGGLLGCWLGISIFTFTDFLEKCVKKVAIWRKRFGKRKKKRAPTPEFRQD